MTKEKTYQINHIWVAKIITYPNGLKLPKQMSKID